MSTQRKGGWGSLLGSAVAGLESRLDTILADDDQASAKSRTADAVAKQEVASKSAPEKQRLQVDQLSRSSSRSRTNSRLQDRLAKAVNKGKEGGESRPSSELGSRPESPALRNAGGSSDVGRASMDSRASESAADTTTGAKEEAIVDVSMQHESDVAKPATESETAIPPRRATVSEQPSAAAMPSMAMPTIVTPAVSTPPPPSIEATASKPSLDASAPEEAGPALSQDPDILQAELIALRQKNDEEQEAHREELNAHLERIDALQSKLTYLAQQLENSSKAAKADAEATPLEKQLADKDIHIAALMEEGQRLSKTEMKHMTTIKKMRAKTLDADKETTLLKQKLAKAQKDVLEHSDRAQRAEGSQKATQEKLQVVAKIEKDISMIRSEREEAGLTISELRRQLNDALSRAEAAEKKVQSGALEAEKRATASLKDDIDNMKIERKLAEDRARQELQTAREEARNQQEKAKIAELELRGEVANLESKLELLRSRSEEVTSSATGDSQAKLLRQIETLQAQYALASENWQGIESTLTSRVAALEKERDDTAKRESEVRRKAREVNSKARRLEDELDTVNDRARTLEQDLQERQASVQKLQARASQAESLADEARTTAERDKKIWEADLQQRLEEERNKLRLELQSHSLVPDGIRLRTDSPNASLRRHSPDPLGIHRRMPRSVSQGLDSPLSPIDRMLDDARRPQVPRQKSHPSRTPDASTPARKDSFPSLVSPGLNGAGIASPSTDTFAAMQTPSIHTADYDDPLDRAASSPHRTINDMISVSTVGAGPSVQLVERMSAAVRRLESEKAVSKEEMARLLAQRDEARDEVVALMLEVEEKRGLSARVDELQRGMADVEGRYESALEMLGERSERVEELEGDVADLKKIYRDLVSTMQ